MRRCLACGKPTTGDLCPECLARFGPGTQGSTGPAADPGPHSRVAPPYPGPPTPPAEYPGPHVPPAAHPSQPAPAQGPGFIYRQGPPQPASDQRGWAYPATAIPGTEPPVRTGRGATIALVVGLAVVVMAAGVGLLMLLLGGGQSELSTDPVAATPAPASTIVVTVEQSAEPTTVAPSTPSVADAPSVVTQSAAQPAQPTQAAPPAEPTQAAPPAAPVKPQAVERYYPLFRGDQGYVVLALQELLGYRGIRTLADGDFGPATERSVRQWQAQEGLEVTGVVDDTTWDSLVPTLSQGSQGDGVEVLQRLLGYRGYSVVVDGDFGPQTDAVVRAFQAERGIPVDGLVGPVTWSTLLA